MRNTMAISDQTRNASNWQRKNEPSEWNLVETVTTKNDIVGSIITINCLKWFEVQRASAKKNNGGNQRTPVANKPLYMRHHCITYYSHCLAPQENQFLSISRWFSYISKSCRLGCGKELTWMLLNVKITLRTAANNCIAWFGVGVWDLRSENVMLQACQQWQWLFLMDYGVSIWKIFGRIYQGSHFLPLKPATPPFPVKGSWARPL